MLRIPALKKFDGKRVEVTVTEIVEQKPKPKNSKSKKTWFERNFGRGWPEDKNDRFETAVRRTALK